MNRQSAKFFSSLCVAMALADESKKEPKPIEKAQNLKKPSKLPLYDEPQDIYSYEYFGKEKTKLEEGVSLTRKELQSLFGATSDVRESIQNVYATGKAHSLSTADYVLDEANVPAKVGAITIGGLLGLLIGGRRKGIFKKLFYTSLGATGTAALVYPKEASQISRELYDNAGDYSLIAYNFIAGVKPQNGSQSPSSPQVPQKPKTSSSNTPSEVSTQPQQSHRSFQSLVRQSSDVTLWGFRLFDRNDVSNMPAQRHFPVNKELIISAHSTNKNDPKVSRSLLNLDNSVVQNESKNTITENKFRDPVISNQSNDSVSQNSDSVILHELKDSDNSKELNDSVSLGKGLRDSVTPDELDKVETIPKLPFHPEINSFKGNKSDSFPNSGNEFKSNSLWKSSTESRIDSLKGETNIIGSDSDSSIKHLDPTPIISKETAAHHEYIDGVSDVLIDSVLNLKIFRIQEEEDPDSETRILNADPQRIDSVPVKKETRMKGTETFMASQNQLGSSGSPIENFADTLIDSMLNLRIVAVEEEDGEEFRVPDEDQARNGSNTESQSESFSDRNEVGTMSFPPSTLRQKVKSFFTFRKKKKSEGEEVDIDEMDQKFISNDKDSAADISDSNDHDHDQDAVSASRVTSKLENDCESDGSFSYVPRCPTISDNDISDVTAMKTSWATAADKESKKDVLVNVTKSPAKVTIKGDHGQSNPEDKDMYTTRS